MSSQLRVFRLVPSSTCYLRQPRYQVALPFKTWIDGKNLPIIFSSIGLGYLMVLHPLHWPLGNTLGCNFSSASLESKSLVSKKGWNQLVYHDYLNISTCTITAEASLLWWIRIGYFRLIQYGSLETKNRVHTSVHTNFSFHV